MGRFAWIRSHWRILALGIATLLVALIALSMWVERAARRRWAAFERGVAELAEEVGKEKIPREPLRPPLGEGNAWPYYLAVLKRLEPLRNQGKLASLLEGDAKANGPRLREELKAWGATLEELRRGARCRLLSSPPGEYLPRGQSDYWTPPERMLTQLAIGQATLLRLDGRNAESLDLLLDLAQFGRDYVELGVPYDYYDTLFIMDAALAEIRAPLVAHTWGTEDLRKLASFLDILDRSFPSWNVAQKEWVAREGRWLLETEHPYTVQTSLGGEIGRTYFRPDWRHAFSMRLYKADAFERMRAALGRPPDRRGKQEFLPEYENTSDLERFFLDNVISREEPGLECRAHLRLLRMATAFILEADIPDLADPFGKRLRVEHIPGGIKLWSVGPDCVDHGGVGEWKPAAGKDIVLTIAR